MEAWSRLEVMREKVEGGRSWKEEEGTRERTCVTDQWTWPTMWELTVGVEEDKEGEK